MPAFESELRPVVAVGENLKLLPESKYGYYRVKYIEPLPEVEKNFGDINAKSTLSAQEVTELYVSDGELAQWRPICVDDIRVTVAQPQAQYRWRTKTTKARFSKTVDQSHLGDLFVFEDEKVYFDVTNPQPDGTPISRIRFRGFRYMLEKLPAPPDRWTAVPVEGAGGAIL